MRIASFWTKFMDKESRAERIGKVERLPLLIKMELTATNFMLPPETNRKREEI